MDGEDVDETWSACHDASPRFSDDEDSGPRFRNDSEIQRVLNNRVELIILPVEE